MAAWPGRMTASTQQTPSADAFRWRQLRHDGRCFDTLAECVEVCLPEFRGCAQLFCGNISAGDQLTEQFLIDLLTAPPTSGDPFTPKGLTAQFEQFLIQKLKQAYCDQKLVGDGPAILSAEDFLEAIARR